MKIRFIDNEEVIKMVESVCEDFKESKLFEISYGEYPMRNSSNRRLYVETPDAMQFFERLYKKLYAKFDEYAVSEYASYAHGKTIGNCSCSDDPENCNAICEYREQCIRDAGIKK